MPPRTRVELERRDEASNLIYVPWPEEHGPISDWWNARRDDIKRHLDIE